MTFFSILFHFIWFQSFFVVVVDCRQTKIEFYFGLRKKMAKDIRIVDYITEKRVVYWWCMVSDGKQTHHERQQARVFWILLIFFLVLFCFLFWISKKNKNSDKISKILFTYDDEDDVKKNQCWCFHSLIVINYILLLLYGISGTHTHKIWFKNINTCRFLITSIDCFELYYTFLSMTTLKKT